ncbi:MAG: hypothetical protein ACRDY1_05680 [Acidimicrobiales bacterium]
MRGIARWGTRRVGKYFAACGVLLAAAGSALVGTPAAAAASPSISITQSAPVTLSGSSSDLSSPVTGSGFHHHAYGALFECSSAGSQPTIEASVIDGLKTVDLSGVPVSCGSETPVVTTGQGDLPATAIVGLQEGVLGPPATGTDSSGGDATTDAGNFPCPPTAAQGSASCVVMYIDAAGDSATSGPITFAAPSPPAPTTCTGQANSVSATNATTGASATLTVTPATCLVGGETVQITGTGLAAGSEGTLLECNSDSSQPTLSLAGQTIPISCTSLDVVETTASGGLTAQQGTFQIVTGTTGPPLAGTDSSGGNDATDAVNYPCPPTTAQVAAGDTCEIVLRDGSGDDLVVPISFNPGGAGTSSTASKTQAATTPTATASSTKASSGSLAFTGAGPLLWMVGLLGLVLVLVGASLTLLSDDRRRMLWAIGGRRPEGPASDR